jgi:hypothetical protein
MATSMAAATIGHAKLLRPLRERDFALLWTGMTVSLSHRTVCKAIGTDATLVPAGVVPMVVLRRALRRGRAAPRYEDLHPLLGEDYADGAGAASATSGSGTPAIS